MKKFLAFVLAALMALPFSVMASAASVPTEPALQNTNKVYTAHDKNPDLGITGSKEGGATADKPFQTSAGWAPLFDLHTAMKDGGTIVVVGKGYFASYTMPATATPLVFTAKDGDTSYISTKDGAIYFMNDSGANAGQYGMFMITENAELTFEGDVIFENIVILSRISKTALDNGKKVGVINVKKSIVIDDTVQFAEMTGKVNYTLNVAGGAYAYIHALGFDKYSGTGTIVVGDEIKDTVTADTFAGFEGKIVLSDGSELKVDTPVTPDTDAPTTNAPTTSTPTTDAPTTSAPTTDDTAADTTSSITPDEVTIGSEESEGAKKDPTETKRAPGATSSPDSTTQPASNADNGNFVWIIVAVVTAAAVAGVVIVIIKKKKA